MITPAAGPLMLTSSVRDGRTALTVTVGTSSQTVLTAADGFDG